MTLLLIYLIGAVVAPALSLLVDHATREPDSPPLRWWAVVLLAVLWPLCIVAVGVLVAWWILGDDRPSEDL